MLALTLVYCQITITPVMLGLTLMYGQCMAQCCWVLCWGWNYNFTSVVGSYADVWPMYDLVLLGPSDYNYTSVAGSYIGVRLSFFQ